MREYNIHVTDAAERDLSRAVDYIEFSLKNPMAAEHLIDETENMLSSLAHMPERFALVDDEMLASLGIRFIQIKSYLAFYVTDYAGDTVHVLRFLYGKSDWVSILHHSMIPE